MAQQPTRSIFGNETDAKEQLRINGLHYMLQGAFYALVAFLGVGVFLAVLILISRILPEESKMAPDPTPVIYENAG